jgi:hypothetical protein
MGQADPLRSPLPVWANLPKEEEARRWYWREWVHTPLTEAEK